MGHAFELVDIGLVGRVLRTRWRWYALGVVLAFVATGVLLPMLDKGYKAEATIQLREEQKSPQLSSILSSLSASDTYNSLDAVLGSRSLAEHLVARPDMVKALELDKQQGSILRDFSSFLESGLFGMEPAGKIAPVDDVRQRLSKRLSLSRSGTTSNVVAVEFSATKEEASEAVLSAVLEEADALMRRINISGMEGRQARVDVMLREASVESTRKSLLQLYERLGADLISARSLSPYAFTIIDAPSVATVRSRPSFIIVWIGITVMFAVVISALAVFTAQVRS